jgi:hypothetical protein
MNGCAKLQNRGQWDQPERRSGSVLVIVMMTLLFAAFALIAFMERASNELLVEQRAAQNRRLRVEACSALETVLAVLEEFRSIDNGLRHPAEGWADPLGFAGYVPLDDNRSIEVTFEDESGKLSLPHANAVLLTNLFRNWGIAQTDAEGLADALMGWMHKNHVYASPILPDYEHGPIPYEPPGRSLRSFGELAAIEKVREFFYQPDGRPNEYWSRFAESISLFDFQRPNINGALPDTLAALGRFNETQQQGVADYLRGAGTFLSQGPGYFQDVAAAQQVAGASGDLTGFASTISALRVRITVREGGAQFRLSAVISPPNGATTVQATATSQRTQASATGAQVQANQSSRSNAEQANVAATAARAGANARNLRYPFTILEMRENAEILSFPLPAVSPAL